VENPFGFPSGMKNFHNSAMFVGGIYHGSVVCLAKGGSSFEVKTDKPWDAWLRADDYRYRRGGPTRPQSEGSTFTGGSRHAGPPLPWAGGDTLFPGCTKEVPSNKEINLNPPTSHAVDTSGEYISGFKGKSVTSLILVGGENNVRGLHDVEFFTDITCPQLSTCMGESVERQTKKRNDPYTHFSQQPHNKLMWLVIFYYFFTKTKQNKTKK